MGLEVQIVWLVAGILSASFGILVMMLRSRYQGYLGRAFQLWGWSCLCIGFAFWMASGSQHAALSLASPSLGIVAITLQYLAVTELKQQRRQKIWARLPWMAACAIYLWFGLVQPNITIGLFLLNILRLMFFLRLSASFAHREDGQRQFVDMLAAVTYLLVAISTAVLIVNFVLTIHFAGSYNFNTARTAYTVASIVVAQAILFALFILAITERLNEQLKHQAMHDSLTNLFNRRAIEQIGFHQESHSSRSGQSLTVFMIDVDRFKEINDEFGHAIGDNALKSVAMALERGLRSEDYLGRWGGDEFCVLLPGATREVAATVAARVIDIVERLEIIVAGRRLTMGISVGIASAEENIGGFDALMGMADAALYEAKRAGRGRYWFASDAVDEARMKSEL
jgi:diguanylate cyclase (GGDEF)-like protein